MITSSRVHHHTKNDAPELTLDDIYWDSTRHAITVGEITIDLTPAEYRLLYPLRHGYPLTFACLAYEMYNHAFDERVRIMMDKHIDRVRTKLRRSRIYIYCVVGYGYILLPIPTAEHVYGPVLFQ
jgi:DNA-binding response OmpR family regulator